MAVYTQVSRDDLDALFARFDYGQLRSAKGIAEGVENSNYLVETDRSRFILTLYEKRVDAADLPFFAAFLDHLDAAGLPVPRMLADREGCIVQNVAGRPACLIPFLAGVSTSSPSADECESVGAALGQMHCAAARFTGGRPNSLGADQWRTLATSCGDLDRIAPGLAHDVKTALDAIESDWPTDLPRHVIHADLFPDNVLMLDGEVTGLIDFYFACTDFRAYDLAVTHAAWCFDSDGAAASADCARAIMRGYARHVTLSDAERTAMPVLAQGAALRFLLTRAYDWFNTPANALVARKDPLPFARRLARYRAPDAASLFIA
jgi:homoserine kinase type II